MSCFSPLKGYRSPEGGLIFKQQLKADGSPDTMSVACGQCFGCRLDRSRMWAARIMHEAHEWPVNSFVTLTYRDPWKCDAEQFKDGYYIPSNGSLAHGHFQDFMKRLRYHHPDQPIRYYMCGEYGDDNYRPHYHACLFNCGWPDAERIQSGPSGEPLWTSKTLASIWKYGYVSVAPLTPANAAYTARYVMKKVTGDRAQDHYMRCDDYGVAYWLEPEYTRMSRGEEYGGIGKKFFEKYSGDFFPSGQTPLLGPSPKVVNGVPRYYEEMHERQLPEEVHAVKQQRKEYVMDNPELFTPEHLETVFKVRSAQLRSLRREI